ncbi:MAG TPA: cadherin repeat domain-containing protein [Candidatus Competibacter sp.]|nr:cadherin repeat domain-containing protein [Candidatus Competibacter sp.]
MTPSQNQLEIQKDQYFVVANTATKKSRIGQVKTTGNPTSYEIVEDNSNGTFEIDKDGNLAVKKADGLEGQKYTLRIKAEDNQKNSSDECIDIYCYSIEKGQNFTVPETADNQELVGKIIISPDKGKVKKFEIKGGNDDKGVFYIQPDTGQIYVSQNQFLDYNTKSIYEIDVSVNVDGCQCKDELIKIMVWGIVANQEYNVKETTKSRESVGNVIVNAPGSHGFYDINFLDKNTPFDIELRTGSIKLKPNVSLNRQKKLRYKIETEATYNSQKSRREIYINIIFDKRMFDELAREATMNNPLKKTKEQLLDFTVPNTTESAQGAIEKRLGQIAEILKNRP